MTTAWPITDWLPPGKTCAVCFSVDDIHPGRSTDAYEAGGDMDRGGLGVLRRLHERQPQFRTTLFVTPDWRQISPFPTRKWLSWLPRLRERVYLAPILPKGTMALHRHQDFLRYLQSIPGVELGLHGLHHVHTGPRISVEFQHQGTQECERILTAAQRLFARAELPAATGLQPPAWNTPDALIQACDRLGLEYIAGARDVITPITADARTAMSGPQGMPLLQPALFPGTNVVHLAANFQATSSPDRAMSILKAGGLLCIKGHIVKQVGTYVALDALGDLYANYLDVLISQITDRFGDDVWFATVGEIAHAARNAALRHKDAA